MGDDDDDDGDMDGDMLYKASKVAPSTISPGRKSLFISINCALLNPGSFSTSSFLRSCLRRDILVDG